METRTREFFEAIGIIKQIFFRLRKDELEIENQRKMKQEGSPIINNIYKEAFYGKNIQFQRNVLAKRSF